MILRDSDLSPVLSALLIWLNETFVGISTKRTRTCPFIGILLVFMRQSYDIFAKWQREWGKIFEGGGKGKC